MRPRDGHVAKLLPHTQRHPTKGLILRYALLGAAALTLSLAACAPAGDTSDTATTPDHATIRLELGDAERGRQVFDDLRCWTCHAVEGEEFHEPVASPPTGVVIGSKWDRRLSPDEIADSILAPSHDIDEAYTEGVAKSGKLSRMGAYSHMEVGQLSDLVAYFTQINERVLGESE